MSAPFAPLPDIPADVLVAVSYGRVSTFAKGSHHGDHKTISVDSQLADNRTVNDRNGWFLWAERRDDGISASNVNGIKTRAGWTETMDLLDSGKVHYLILKEISRGTRDRMVYAALFSVCQEHGIRIVLDGRIYDPNDPGDAMALDINAMMAFGESARTAKRGKSGSETRKREGRPHGRTPFGYVREYHSSTGALIGQHENPETAPIVRLIVALVIAGWTLTRIAKRLNTEGAQTSYRAGVSHRGARRNGEEVTGEQRWTGLMVRRIAVNPVYAGLRFNHGKRVETDGTWDALISVEEHDEAKRILESPDRISHGGDVSAKWLLTGHATCGACGGPMKVHPTGNNNVPAYRCREGHLGRKVENVDYVVTSYVLGILGDATELDRLLTAPDDSQYAVHAAEAKRLRTRVDSIRAAIQSGDLEPTDGGPMIKALNAEIAQLDEKATPPTVPAALKGFRDVSSVADHWAGLLIEQRRELVRYLTRVTVLRTRKGSKFDPSSILIGRP